MKIRKFLKNFVPYSWEPSTDDIANSIGKNPNEITRFDTNVSHKTPIEWLEELSKEFNHLEINRYPDSSYISVRKLLADYCSCNVDNLILTNGADEGLFMIGSMFIEPSSDVILSTPTYSYYEKMIQIMGGNVKEITRNSDFSDDFTKISNSINYNTSLIILCSPNNPTGNLVDKNSLEKLLSSSDVPVIVDEAYFEFTEETVADLVNRYDNLIVVRTFSKAFGLAGLRVGYLLSSISTTSLLNKVRPPNSVGELSVNLSRIALNNIDWIENNVKEILSEKILFIEQVSKIKNVEIIPSTSNFMLLKFTNTGGADIYEKLLRKGIVVRDVSGTPGLENYIRINIGLHDENNKLIQAIEEVSV